jgi:hypothetical protein
MLPQRYKYQELRRAPSERCKKVHYECIMRYIAAISNDHLGVAFLIPGISPHSMIVLTFCAMDAVNCQQYNIVGQTVMSLRDYPQFKNNMDFESRIEISTRINVSRY